MEELEKENLYKMSQIQGKDEIFSYYTFDNECIENRPHVHLCVKQDNNNWEGICFTNNQNLKTVATVFLDFNKLKNKEPYTVDNLEFELINDDKVLSNSYKQTICNWLNTIVEDDFGNKIVRTVKCFDDYKLSNNECIYFKNSDNYK